MAAISRRGTGGVIAALLLIGWATIATIATASCDSGSGRPAARSQRPAGSGSAGVAGDEGKGGTQLDFPAPPPPSASPTRQPAPTVLQVDPTAQPLAGSNPRIGPLFAPDPNGPHFCTASVVPSPGHNLLMTAAHCINDGRGQGSSAIVFIPGYSNGVGPYGVWTPRALIVAPQWANGADPDYDVGFVVLNPSGGKNIQDLVGADPIEFNPGFINLVQVTGYPQQQDFPITCENWTSKLSATQVRFACGGFYGGTSGSPWIAVGRNARQARIVGVIGGYQRGGDTNSVSFSVYLGRSIQVLYQQAKAASTAHAS